MGKVVKLELVTVGDAYKFDVKKVLRAALKANMQSVLIAGVDANGELYIASSCSIAESMLLAERAKFHMLP